MLRPSTAPGPALALSALLLVPDALAQSPDAAKPDPSATLPSLEVIGRAPGSLTQPGVDEQRRTLEQTAAAVRLVPSEEFQNRYAFNLRDVLPGRQAFSCRAATGRS